MDKLTHYQTVLRAVLQEYEAQGTQDAFEPITSHIVCDDEHSEYLMLNVGHDTVWDRWLHVVLFHAWIRDNKIWVACDNISPSVISELVEKGIPSTDILPAAEQPFTREHTPIATAYSA